VGSNSPLPTEQLLFAVSSLAAGNFGGAIFSGAIAGILAWQMT
jgi:hypothetical protein